MGYAMLMTPCLRCGQVFGCNPHRVPSIRMPSGEKEALCSTCFDTLNRKRVALGIPPWPDPHPEAYDAIDENEL